MKICFKKKTKPNKTTKKKISLAGVKPPTFDVQGQGVIYCAINSRKTSMVLTCFDGKSRTLANGR